jgi:hypothetical protein
LEFFKNGVSQGVAFSDLKNDTWFFSAQGGSAVQIAMNFGQQPFKYAPPAGFKALCSKNLAHCEPFPKPDGNAANNVTLTLTAGQFKYLGYAPTVATGVTWGTQLNKIANGVKCNTAGTYTITNSDKRIKLGRAQGNP